MSNVSGLVRSSSTVRVGTDPTVGPFLNVNSDGSINVNASLGTGGTVVNVYNESNSIASGATVAINTYTVPVGKTSTLQIIEVGGQNIAIYDIYVNSSKIARKRTYFGGSLSSNINFYEGSGLVLNTGDVLQIQVTNFRPTTADFESRIQVIETI